jgi:hypothetical protein
MARKRTESFPLLAAAAGALLAAAVPAAAQAAPAGPAAHAPGLPADTGLVYRREVFQYQPVGRPDPFRPLLNAADLGVRLEDLRLTAVVYHPNPRLALAVFTRGDTSRAIRVRVGQRIGGLTVLAIYPRRVDVRVDEFGTSRVESVGLKRAVFSPEAAAAATLSPIAPSAGAAPAGAAGQQGGQPAAQVPERPQPLSRGGRKPASPNPPAAAPQQNQAAPQARRPTYP